MGKISNLFNKLFRKKTTATVVIETYDQSTWLSKLGLDPKALDSKWPYYIEYLKRAGYNYVDSSRLMTKQEFGGQLGITTSNGSMIPHPDLNDNGASLYDAYQKL